MTYQIGHCPVCGNEPGSSIRIRRPLPLPGCKRASPDLHYYCRGCTAAWTETYAAVCRETGIALSLPVRVEVHGCVPYAGAPD